MGEIRQVDPRGFDPHQPLRTRDGRAAVLLSDNDPQTMGPYVYPIKAKVEHPNEPGEWVEWHYLPDGRWKSNDSENPNDLVNVRAN